MAAAPDNEAIAIPIKVVPNAPIALKVPASTLAAANLNVATATIVLATLFDSCGIAEAIESKPRLFLVVLFHSQDLAA